MKALTSGSFNQFAFKKIKNPLMSTAPLVGAVHIHYSINLSWKLNRLPKIDKFCCNNLAYDHSQ